LGNKSKPSFSLIGGERQLSEENFDWIFVNMVPMLCDKTRIAKQQKIETWLNLYQLAKKLGLDNAERQNSVSSMSYVV
jgi:hypothetical protein